jgi:hypothetical protein
VADRAGDSFCLRTVVATRSPFGDAPLVRSAAANDAYFVRVHHSGPLAGGSARRSFAAEAATRRSALRLLLSDSSGHGAERRRVADHVDARGLLLDACIGHAGVVAAFLCLRSRCSRAARSLGSFRSITDSPSSRVFCFHACGRLLAIGQAASTARSRTRVSSPRRSPAARRRERKAIPVLN